jgi:hypothetical protein
MSTKWGPGPFGIHEADLGGGVGICPVSKYCGPEGSACGAIAP